MSKKKKKNKKKEMYDFLDAQLDQKYIDSIKEIELMKKDLKKAKKKSKKKKYKNGLFKASDYQIIARKRITNQMEDSNWFQRMYDILEELKPIVKIIARLIASLIVSILSIVDISKYIKPKTLHKLDKLYNFVMNI